MSKASFNGAVEMEEAVAESADMVMYDALPAPAPASGVDAGEIAEVALRSDFASSLAFEPFLYSDPSGDLTLKFRTSDKLSTFIVQVYAHDVNMQNALVRQEMVVSLPVKLDIVAIVREALTNAAKHGHARNAAIASDPLPDGGFVLTVANDGEPFDRERAAGPAEGHYGLSGMEERAARIGGKLSFGRKDAWTTVRLEVGP